MSNEKLVRESLLNIVDAIDVGNSRIDNDDMLQIVELVNNVTNTNNKLSKYQACKYLHVSRATFDNWVKDKKIPEGKKEQGFKEKFWLLKDLKEFKENNKK